MHRFAYKRSAPIAFVLLLLLMSQFLWVSQKTVEPFFFGLAQLRCQRLIVPGSDHAGHGLLCVNVHLVLIHAEGLAMRTKHEAVGLGALGGKLVIDDLTNEI